MQERELKKDKSIEVLRHERKIEQQKMIELHRLKEIDVVKNLD